jgi:predicted DNA binding CopG/RHH family protein
MKEELKNKNFRNEAEEAQWWDANQDALAEEFEKAAAAGTLGRGTVARKGNTPAITIRLDPNDVAKARLQAEHRGLRYQTYLKMLVHEALRDMEHQLMASHEKGIAMTSDERLFVERRAQGDYAVRKPKSERASAVLPTQAEAIDKARDLNPGTAPLVERVRHTSVGKPDKWRKP